MSFGYIDSLRGGVCTNIGTFASASSAFFDVAPNEQGSSDLVFSSISSLLGDSISIDCDVPTCKASLSFFLSMSFSRSAASSLRWLINILSMRVLVAIKRVIDYSSQKVR